MELTNFAFTIFIVFLIGIQESSTKETDEPAIQQLDKRSNPLANLMLNESEIGDVKRNGNHTKDNLLRVKRQFSYDPYYRRRVPVPIIVGGFGVGGFGVGGFGGRGFGGRGFGGRGFGGRGFGGRGFGGRGFGGRGIGGARGGFGGGRGGRG